MTSPTMKTAGIVSFNGYARVRSYYQCRTCGMIQAGTTFTVDLTHYVLEDVTEIENGRPEARNMPIGWASYTDGYSCSSCNKETK